MLTSPNIHYYADCLMTFIFKEIDFQRTPLGDISLRKRAEPRLNNKILYEVKLNEEFLMSSLFVEAEVALSNLGLAPLSNSFDDGLDVIVGGLGLGHTALTALEHRQVRSLQVIEVMDAVIRWHNNDLVPRGRELATEPRCRLVQADFFEAATNPCLNFDGSACAEGEYKQVHAVLLDIDHSPSYWLNPGNNRFYTEEGLRAMADKIVPGGVFALWSDELPDAEFTARLAAIFDSVETHIIRFANPYTQGESTNSVYVAKKSA